MLHRAVQTLARLSSASSLVRAPASSTSAAAAAVRQFRSTPSAWAFSSLLAPSVAARPAAAHTHSCRCCTGRVASTAASTAASLSSSARRVFSTIEAVPPPSTAVSAAAASSSATTTADPAARFVAVYTCKVCSTRAAKSISRQAYTEGVVLVRCDGCSKLHLFADHLGWFDDQSVDIESIMKEKGMGVSRSSIDLTPEQLAQIGQMQQTMADKAKSAEARQAAQAIDEKLKAAGQAPITQEAVLDAEHKTKQ